MNDLPPPMKPAAQTPSIDSRVEVSDPRAADIRVVCCTTSSNQFFSWRYLGCDHRKVKLIVGQTAASPHFNFTYDDALEVIEAMNHLESVMADREAARRCG